MSKSLMASITTTMVLLHLFSFLSSLCLASQSSHTGFTLELIPPCSPKSPLFIPNNLGIIHARVHHEPPPAPPSLTSMNASDLSHSHIITPPIERKFESSFVVKVGLGTFEFDEGLPSTSKSYYLILDTGSSLTWTQCEDCKLPGNACYKQKDAPFPNKHSKSYDPLPCNKHPLCKPNKCVGDHCSYSVKYTDGAYSSGILATETFSFLSSSTSQTEKIPRIVFGCGVKNIDPKESDAYEIAGVFGLGQGDRSFVKQIQKKSNGRFSYCLASVMENQNPPNMYLRFGADIKPPRDLRTTSFFKIGRFDAYYVKLLDLGVNGKRLGIDPSVFAVRSDGKGGCVVDSGSSFSYIIKAAYEILEKRLKQYFSGLKEFIRDRTQPERLCYKRNDVLQGFSKIPSVNFYFEGAEMDVGPEGTFKREVKRGKEVFCLMIEADESLSTIGAYQQVNYKFIYDTTSNKLHFGPEDCARNG